MSKKSLQKKTISRTSHLILLVGDFLLLGLLGSNLVQLFRIKAKTDAVLASDILSVDPAGFISKVTASGVAWWVWLINIGGLVVTVVLIIFLFVPTLKIRKLAIANTAWLGAWLAYIIVSLIIVAVVAVPFLGFT